MSALTDRIAEVLRAHIGRPVSDTTSRPGFRIWLQGCQCYWTGEDHAAHVAERVEAELGLKRRLSYPVIGDQPPGDGLYERWVSAWSEVES